MRRLRVVESKTRSRGHCLTPRWTRTATLAVLPALAGILLVSGARAECEGEAGAIHVFSGIAAPDSPGTPAPPFPGTKVYGCTSGAADTNIVLPGANALTARYTEDLKVPQLTGHIKGLGLDKDIVLKRGQGTQSALLEPVLGPSYTYDTPRLYIDPTATGDLVVTVNLDTGPVTEKFHRP